LGYESNHPFDSKGACFSASGIPFYVCPGTSSWNSISGRTENALGNLKNAAKNGRINGATGYLITDWGDNGHWQPIPVSYLGFAAGAAFSWCIDKNSEDSVYEWLDHIVFEDQAEKMGRLVADLGNAYRAVGFTPGNASALFLAMQTPLIDVKRLALEKALDIHGVLAQLDQFDQEVNRVRLPLGTESDKILKEYRFISHLLRHACNRIGFALNPADETKRALAIDLEEILSEFKSIWLERNRPGGLKDSLERFAIARREYV
jgi:hypothetical protein